MRAALGGITVVCILLGIAMTNRSSGLAVRNVLSFGVPVCAYAWLLYRRQLGWVRLGIVAVASSLIVLAVDFHYQDPPIDGYRIVNALLPNVRVRSPPDWTEHAKRAYAVATVGLATIRALVPLFGLLSFLTIVCAINSIIGRRWGQILRMVTSAE